MAVEILYRRYVKGSIDRERSLQFERLGAGIARLVRDQRTVAGMSQKELAVLADTTQSVISRLEDADYDGHSLSTLSRIATALDRKLIIGMVKQ